MLIVCFHVQVEGKENSSTASNVASIPSDPLVNKQLKELGSDANTWIAYCSRVLMPSDALSVLRAV